MAQPGVPPGAGAEVEAAKASVTAVTAAAVVTAAWRLRVEVDEPDAVLLSVARGLPSGAQETAGFASAGPVRDPRGAGAWELYAIGVEPGLRGSGAADELVRRAVGDRSCIVWVERSNSRARSFYARHGFVADGAERLHESLGLPEVRLARAAGGRSPQERPRGGSATTATLGA